jgi:hypothetical protein
MVAGLRAFVGRQGAMKPAGRGRGRNNMGAVNASKGRDRQGPRLPKEQSATELFWGRRLGAGWRCGAGFRQVRVPSRLRAKIRAGELLAEAAERKERHSGHGDQKTGSQSATPKLKDLGINNAASAFASCGHATP